MDRTIVVICGPTAVGKTAYAIRAAQALDGEIVSCDSMQLYKYMDIGSAKPTPEERAAVLHYLVDEIDPAEEFSVAKFQKLARDAIETIFRKGKLPVIAGGTGLYVNSILYDMDFSAPPKESGYREELYAIAEEQGPEALHARLMEADPEAAGRIHPNNIKKVVRAIEAAEEGTPVRNFRTDLKKTEAYRAVVVVLTRDREELYDRINRRVDILMEMGLLDEVKGLLARGLTADDISMKGIGYKELIGYLEGKYDLPEAVRLIKRNTRHLAKRQMTWFRRLEDAKWFDISTYENDEACIKEMILWLKTEISR